MKAGVLLLIAAAVTLRAADLSGVWEVRISGGKLNDARRVKFTPKDGRHEWTFFGSQFAGAAQGDSITFKCTEEGKGCGELTGRVEESGISRRRHIRWHPDQMVCAKAYAPPGHTHPSRIRSNDIPPRILRHERASTTALPR